MTGSQVLDQSHRSPFLRDAISRFLRELTKRIAKERDPEKLRELVVGINLLLDAIEAALAKIEEYSEPSDA